MKSWTWGQSAVVWLGLVGVALGAACGGQVGEESPGPGSGPDGCVSKREQFAREVWGRVLGQRCVQCHAPGGIAAEANAALKLLPATYPGFLEANYENVTQVAKMSFDGKPVILQKPIGGLSHGGGAPLSDGSPEYTILKNFVASVGEPEQCMDSGSAVNAAGLQLLDAQGTFRKAALQLGDRLPTDAERARLEQEGDAALSPLLEELMKENGFVDRVVELYNDRLLTDRYANYGSAIGLLNREDYPGANGYDAMAEDLRQRANLGVAREPLYIIARVVREDLPFSEILTANYTVVNDGSAQIYGVNATFKNAADAREWQTGQVSMLRDGAATPIPHAGVLTTPAFLNRFPTTPTNRNRHRARKVYEFFLATDILKAADRPLDPLASTNFNNPTRDDAQCNVCHRQIDPIAGAFMKWDDNDQERYRPMKEWHQEMVAPGFGGETMPTAEFGRAQQWLAERIVADPRFVLSTVHTVFRAITGQEPLDYPLDATAGDYPAQLAAWLEQDATFQSIGQRFVDDGTRFKTVVRELVLSPYFRAQNLDTEPTAERAAELVAVGTGRLSAPERLSAKIEAATGVPWSRGAQNRPWLLDSYRVLYGGIDSDSVTARLSQPNGIIASVAERMANEVACAATAYDFSRPMAERKLFPGVQVGDVPQTAVGATVPESVDRIRATLQYLHERLLGEKLARDSAEIDRSYQLFLDTWRELSGSATAMDRNHNLTWTCRARVNPKTGAELPAGEVIDRDENYTIRSWMAVVSYLLSDYRFLYEP